MNKLMWAMTLPEVGGLLTLNEIPKPKAHSGQLLVRVAACGVCRTDLHIVDGDLPVRHRDVVPGHEVVGYVVAVGNGCQKFKVGQRVGIPWLAQTCGTCTYCADHRENLCDSPRFTGYDCNGGFAQFIAADERYCLHIPEIYDDLHAAPLMCAGLIGFRAYRACDLPGVENIGIYGFGAAAHILCQIAVSQGKRVYAFVRPGDESGERFALDMGACWAGPSDTSAPRLLDATLIFAPVGGLVPLALQGLRKGGAAVCAGIHMSKIPSFNYSLLWGERSIRSVANLTREDGELFFEYISRHPVKTRVHSYPLSSANDAISALRSGTIDGSAVLVP